MKFETLAKRVALKVGFPPLEKALLKGDASLIPHETCLHWTGASTREGHFLQMERDANMRPSLCPVYRKSFPRIRFEKVETYVHRLVYEKTEGLLPGGRLKNLCGDTLCINPHHWGPSYPKNEIEELEEAPEYSTDWTVEDAVIALRILPPDDPEFEDMPAEIMQLALKELNP